DNYTKLILATNAIITDVAKDADVILITPNVVLQARAHTISIARLILYNKASKENKPSSLTSLV
ncbi:hypothetical protein K504DRAFT_387693, partial [Pleomassaria siparia CBS 279.74]